MIAPDVDRQRPPANGDERAMLEGWLDFQRATLLQKCAGLTEERLTAASCPPSNLTLLGLVRHMAEVERNWFRAVFLGADLDDLYGNDEAPTEWEVAGADAGADFDTFHEEVRLAQEAAAGRSLDEAFPHPIPGRGGEMNLRWIYVHMIEEYARHNGHADFLRERIDGATGV